jgi:hypothetical protein
MCIWYFIEYAFQFLVDADFHIIKFIFCWDMNVQNNEITLMTSQYYVHPVTNKLNPLNY